MVFVLLVLLASWKRPSSGSLLRREVAGFGMVGFGIVNVGFGIVGLLALVFCVRLCFIVVVSPSGNITVTIGLGLLMGDFFATLAFVRIPVLAEPFNPVADGMCIITARLASAIAKIRVRSAFEMRFDGGCDFDILTFVCDEILACVEIIRAF